MRLVRNLTIEKSEIEKSEIEKAETEKPVVEKIETDNTLADRATEENVIENEKNENLSRRTRLVKELVEAFHHNDRLQNHFVEPHRNDSDFDKNYRYPEHLTVQKIEMEHFKMELLQWTGELKWEENGKKWVVLQLHGGGYVNAFKSHYRSMAGLFSEVGKGASVLSIDYRVAPENPFPAALEDAVAAYKWLLEHGYEKTQIVLAGDSAGGGLALALCMYIRDHELPMPAGIVCMSPWTDLTCSGASYKDKFEVDVVFGKLTDSLVFDNPYPGEENPTNPYISPAFGSFEGFPPILIQVGTDEMLLDDSKVVAEKAKQEKVKVRLTEYEGMFHVFQAGGTLMEESKRAWVEIGKFLDVLRGTEENDQ